jgi:polyisoprenoid-binding protein YceI
MRRLALCPNLWQPGLPVFLTLVFMAAPVRAQQSQTIVLEIDPAKTHVEFNLDAFLHTVHGTLRTTQGRIEVDPATGKIGGTIVVDARSAGTGNDGRDNKMHKEILESQRYPEIVFTPAQVRGPLASEGRSNVYLRGTVTLHGQEQEITAPVDVQITGNEWSGEMTFAVPYVQWGLKNPSTLFLRVKDTVNVTVHAAGTLSGGAPQP